MQNVLERREKRNCVATRVPQINDPGRDTQSNHGAESHPRRDGHLLLQRRQLVCPMFCTSWIVIVAQRVLLISGRSRGCGRRANAAGIAAHGDPESHGRRIYRQARRQDSGRLLGTQDERVAGGRAAGEDGD